MKLQYIAPRPRCVLTVFMKITGLLTVEKLLAVHYVRHLNF